MTHTGLRPLPTEDPVSDDNFSDITSAPVLVSMIIGAVLLLLVVICRACLLIRRQKTRPATANNGVEAGNTQTRSNTAPTFYSDAPPSYDSVHSNQNPTDEVVVPGVYLNGSAEADDPPPPKYYDIIKETPPLTTINDSSK